MAVFIEYLKLNYQIDEIISVVCAITACSQNVNGHILLIHDPIL